MPGWGATITGYRNRAAPAAEALTPVISRNDELHYSAGCSRRKLLTVVKTFKSRELT